MGEVNKKKILPRCTHSLTLLLMWVSVSNVYCEMSNYECDVNETICVTIHGCYCQSVFSTKIKQFSDSVESLKIV